MNDKKQEEYSEQKILKQLSSFARKEPSLEGSQSLAKYAKQCDLSYASTLISVAKRYFGQAFKQWSKYRLTIGKSVAAFMNILYSKISHSKIVSLQTLFAPLKELYEKSTHRSVVLLKEDEVNFGKSDSTNSKAKEFASRQTKQASQEHHMPYQQNQIFNEPKEKIEGVQLNEKNLIPEQKYGQKIQLAKVKNWKQLYFRERLRYSSFFKRYSNLQQSVTAFEQLPQWKFSQQISKKLTNYRDCACCLTHVYEGQDLAYPPCKQPVAFLGSLSKNALMQLAISSQVVSYLNAQGGVLLIGCSQGSDGQVFPLKQSTSESMKESIQNRVQSLLQNIYPAVTLKRQIDMSFIPVRANLMSNQGWIKGAYLLRIVVTPTDPQYTYFYTFNQQQNFSKQGLLTSEPLKKENIYNFMKQRYISNATNTVNRLGGLRERGNSLPAVVIHGGTCQMPEKGDQEFAGQEISLGLGQQEIKKSNPLMLGREGFKQISLLVVGQKALETIKGIFRDKQKLQALIQPAFKEFDYRLSNTTWLVWHNVKFEKLMNGIKKEMVNLRALNDRKPPHLISTCSTLKLLAPKLLPSEKITQLKQFAQQKAQEQIQHKLKDGYDYIKCSSIITAVLLYYRLMNQNLKTVFQKLPMSSNPKHKHTRPDQAEQKGKQSKKRYQNSSKKQTRRENSPSNRQDSSYSEEEQAYEQQYQEPMRESIAHDNSMHVENEVNQTDPNVIYEVWRVANPLQGTWCYLSNWTVYFYDLFNVMREVRYYSQEELDQVMYNYQK